MSMERGILNPRQRAARNVYLAIGTLANAIPDASTQNASDTGRNTTTPPFVTGSGTKTAIAFVSPPHRSVVRILTLSHT